MLPVDVDVDFELDVVPLVVPELPTVPVFPEVPELPVLPEVPVVPAFPVLPVVLPVLPVVLPALPVVPDFVLDEDDLLVLNVPVPLDVVGALVVERLENVLGW